MLHQPFGARWKVLVRCHCAPSAIGSSRSDEIRIERRRTPRRGRPVSEADPGAREPMVKFGIFAVKVKCGGEMKLKYSQESIVDI